MVFWRWMANDLVLLRQLEGNQLDVGDGEGPDSINVHSDEEFIRIGFLSLAPPE